MPKKLTKSDGKGFSLTEDQVHTNIRNIANAMRLPEPKSIFKGKIKPTAEEVAKYSLNVLKNKADEYELLECENAFYFIVIYSKKFDVQYFLSIDWFDHLLKPFVKENAERPKVYVCCSAIISDNDYDSIPLHLLKCSYRLCPLQYLHPITGSKNGFEGYCLNYELLNTREKAYNGKEWPEIRDCDPAVKLVNALPGDLIRTQQLFSDKGNCYTTYEIRRVIPWRERLSLHPESGICLSVEAESLK